ncbi:hypothetical protein IV203_014101 [Nitzschia inconspicua]|uniref:DUF6824 domain-containing protein n=1 Tax=Nitzschia inconspicua TaxID=303405 RepID=A0A9K3M814_9STRA|nr:hypothetical protein IV203_014289 [Nitzschia inconspicua]KAG7375006.1 hypothetical protein IV203_014101 [Nitzschia inconspicua]
MSAAVSSRHHSANEGHQSAAGFHSLVTSPFDNGEEDTCKLNEDLFFGIMEDLGSMETTRNGDSFAEPIPSSSPDSILLEFRSMCHDDESTSRSCHTKNNHYNVIHVDMIPKRYAQQISQPACTDHEKYLEETAPLDPLESQTSIGTCPGNPWSCKWPNHRMKNSSRDESNGQGGELDWQMLLVILAGESSFPPAKMVAAEATSAKTKTTENLPPPAHENIDCEFDFTLEEIELLAREDPNKPCLMDDSSYTHSNDDEHFDSSFSNSSYEEGLDVYGLPVCVTPSPMTGNVPILQDLIDSHDSISSMDSHTTGSVYSTVTEDTGRCSTAKKGNARKAHSDKRVRKHDPLVKKYVKYNSRDVLLGRGGKTNRHAGNKVYRRRILEDQPVYKTLCTSEKTKLSDKVVNWIQKDCNGRFLEEDEHGWFIVTDCTARKKVSQALREDHTKEGRAAKKARNERNNSSSFGRKKDYRRSKNE